MRRANAASAAYRASVDATLLRAARIYFQLAASHARQGIAKDDTRAAQELVRIYRTETGIETEPLMPVRFVPLVTEQKRTAQRM